MYRNPEHYPEPTGGCRPLSAAQKGEPFEYRKTV